MIIGDVAVTGAASRLAEATAVTPALVDYFSSLTLCALRLDRNAVADWDVRNVDDRCNTAIGADDYLWPRKVVIGRFTTPELSVPS
jgi:hypothetical protein